MDKPDFELLEGLLTDCRIATLAVLVDDAPFASLVPFAMSARFDSAWIHASHLARHSQGLGDGALYSLLIHQPDTHPETNPAQLARATLGGEVVSLPRDSDEYLEGRSRYLAKFPKSEITFQLGDFRLYRLEIQTCRFVAGFAKTFDLTAVDLGRFA